MNHALVSKCRVTPVLFVKLILPCAMLYQDVVLYSFSLSGPILEESLGMLGLF